MNRSCILSAVFGFAFLTSCVGCASSSPGSGQSDRTIAEQPIPEIVVNKTTLVELEAKFGQPDPNATQESSEGTIYIWSDTGDKMREHMYKSMIPLVGFFMTKPPEMHSLTVTLREGVVTEFRTRGKDALKELALTRTK